MKQGKTIGAAGRAARSIVRHPVRSLLLAGIVACISCLVVSSLAALGASVATQAEGAGASSGCYRLELDIGNLRKRMSELPAEYSHVDEGGNWSTELPNNAFQSVLMDDAERLSETEGVSDWTVVSTPVPTLLPDLKRVEDPDRDQSLDYRGVNVIGTRSLSLEQNFVSGNVELVEGRLVGPGDEHSVVISEDLAELNGLSLGDEMVLEDAKDPEGSEPVTGTIVGVFRILHEIPSTMTGDTFRSENTVFSDLALSQEVAGRANDPLYLYASYSVSDPSEYAEVGERLRESGIDWDRYQLVDDSGVTERMSSNFEGLESSTWTFMAAVIGCGTILVALSMAFWAKARGREAGILLSLGNTRRSVICQVAGEAVAIALAGCIIGCAASWPMSGAVAGAIADQRVQSSAREAAADAGMVAGGSDEAESVVGTSTEPSQLQAVATTAACVAVVGAAAAAALAPAVAQGPRRALEESE